MTYPQYGQQPHVEAPTCYRHPDRHTYIRCTRCGRYICPDCMRSAAVGHQCPECVHEGAKSVRPVRTQFGGRAGSGKPMVTYVLIAVNVAAFILQQGLPGFQSALVMWSPAVAGGEYFRLVSSAFLHGGLTHLLLNMLALYFVGPPLEMALGRLRYGALYGVSALGGSVLVYLLTPINVPTLGASGAVFGLFGATFVVAKRLNLDIRGIAAIIGINLIFTFVYPLISSQNISWQGHLGGLVTGALIAWAYAYAPRTQRNLIQGGVTAAVIVLFLVLIAWRTQEIRELFTLVP